MYHHNTVIETGTRFNKMRNFAALGLLGAAALVAASDVHDLKTDSFKPFVEENDLVLAECK